MWTALHLLDQASGQPSAKYIGLFFDNHGEVLGGDKKLRSIGWCGNVGLTLDHSALLDEAVTDFLCLDGHAILITESDDWSSR